MADIRVILLLILEAGFAFYLLFRSGVLSAGAGGRRLLSCSAPSFLISLLLLAAAFWLRASFFDFATNDYRTFLSQWVLTLKELGGFKGLATPIGNYNIPYLYFLALFSYLDIPDLYLIKLLSVFFDVILAWASMQLLGLFTQKRAARLGCFFAVLFLPTVVLNGALWGQCDSIYVSLALLGIYLALSDRPVCSMICAALSFGFKLQAVFILPVYAVLWFRGKFKLRHFLVFPLAYVLLVLPAVLLGRPFFDTLALYFNQAESIGTGLNYNSPSLFAFHFFYTIEDPLLISRISTAAIAAAFCFMLAVLALCLVFRRRLNDRVVLGVALLFVIGIPFLLPHMHERYFFAADILSLVLAFVYPPYLAVAILVQFSSLICYANYLLIDFVFSLGYGTRALFLALLLSSIFVALALRGKKEKKAEFLS